MSVEKAKFRNPMPDCELRLEMGAMVTWKSMEIQRNSKVNGKRMADAEWAIL